MRKIPMLLFRCHITLEMLQDIRDYVQSKPFPSEAEAARYFLSLGMKIEALKSIIDDPEKKKQFIEEMNKMLKDDKIFNWLETLDDTVLKAVVAGGSIELERRAPKQRNLAI